MTRNDTQQCVHYYYFIHRIQKICEILFFFKKKTKKANNIDMSFHLKIISFKNNKIITINIKKKNKL